MMQNVKFTRALVTGATSGIGEALCFLLAKKGIPLIISGRNEEKLHSLTTALKEYTDVVSIAADLGTEERNKIIKAIHIYAPDLIVNNAGFGQYGEAIASSTELEMQILNVNANAVLELTLEAAKVLKAKEKKGIIMNIASVAAFIPFPYSAVYAASKAFVLRFSQALDFELEPYGIRVLTSCPGMVKTEFNARAGGRMIPTQHAFAMTAEYAAEQVWWQIQKQKPVHVFDWKNRLAIGLCGWLPTRMVMAFLKSRIATRITSS